MSSVRNDFKALAKRLIQATARVTTDALLEIAQDINPNASGAYDYFTYVNFFMLTLLYFHNFSSTRWKDV